MVVPEIITLLLAPFLLSYYWNVSIRSFLILPRCFQCCISTYEIDCPSDTAPTLKHAIALATSTANIFGTRTIHTIHLQGAHHTTESIAIDSPHKLLILGTSTMAMDLNPTAHKVPTPTKKDPKFTPTTLTLESSFAVVDQGNVTLRHLHIHSGVGVQATDGGTLTLEQCEITHCTSSGAFARRGGRLQVDQCRVTHNSGSGVVCGDSGSRITVTDCTLCNNTASGVYCYFGGVGDIHGDRTVVSKNGLNDLRARGGTINVLLSDDTDLICQRSVEAGGIIV